jgi:FG-GAP-like repeat
MKPTLLGGMMLAVALAVAGQTTKPTPTTTLTSSSATLQLPGSLTLTATVAPTATTGGMPTGSVQFLNGTNSLGMANLAVIPSTENFSAPAMNEAFGLSPFGVFALPSATAPYSVLGILDWYQIPNAAAVVYEPQVTIFSGQGTSLFQAPTSTKIPNSGFTYTGSVDTYAIGDFNHDGLPDVLLHGFGGNGNQYYLLPGTAGGGFDPTKGVTSPDAASLASCFQCSFTIAADDFNEDGYPDVAYMSIGSNTIGVALNAGAGTPGSFPSTGFHSAPPLTDAAADTFSSAALASGHFTSSGHADLVVAGYFYSPTTGEAALPGNVALFTGNGDGTFGTPVVFNSSTGTTPTAVATADLRGNGMTDVVLANAVYTPPETGGIRQARTTAALDPPSYTIQVFFGDGQGGLTTSSTVTLPVAPASLTIVDFNKDGYPDILVTGTDGSLNLILNDGTGHFSTATAIGTTSGVLSLTAIGDFNGDGLADIAEITNYPVSDSDTTSTASALLNSASSQATLNTPPQTMSAGTDTLTASFSSENNFAASTSVGVAITVTQTMPTIAWPTPAAIQYGTALSAMQLNATSSVPGSFTYGPAAGTVPRAGRTTVTAVFAPTDSFDYSGATATQTITVTQVAPTITWPTPAAIQYGIALSATQLNATASVPGSFTYSSLAGTVLRAGKTTVTAVFTPTDSVDYSGATATETITVTQAVPTLTWPAPAAIQYGTALSAMQLNATTSVPGTFTYSSPVGTVLRAGKTTVTAVFTPTDNVDYSGATTTQTITVTQAASTLTWAAPAAIQYGTALSATQLNATASVQGSFTYSPAAGTVLRAGKTTVTAVFTPTDSVDYSGATATQTITITQAVPTITWATPPSMQSGTALSATQLDATASVPGTFTYSPAVGTVLPMGQTTVTAVFAPTDSVDYSNATATQTITVIASPATAKANAPATTNTGQTESASLTVNPYPLPITATLTLSFAPEAPNTVSDPAVLFPNNTTTEVIQIPANTTANQSIDFSTGSTAGTITLTVVLTAGGANVTPTTLTPLDISVPAAPPVINSATLTRNAKMMTVTILGLSSTRDMTQAHFHFTPAAGQSLKTTDLTVDLTSPFGSWYGSSTSDTFGTTFLYTQPFTLDSDASTVGIVTVTLTNSKGDSQPGTAQ